MIDRVEHANGVVTYQSPLLSDAGLRHAFTTRIGGVSTGPYASLNLATLAKDEQTDPNLNVAENYRRLRRAIGCSQYRRVETKQVHGCHVFVPPPELIKPRDVLPADAIVSDRPGLMLTIRTADCVPILMSDRRGRIAAAIHAGWRGLLAGVIGQTVHLITQRFEFERKQLIAAIGPCIQFDQYEIGQELADAFRIAGLSDAIQQDNCHKPHVNLRTAAVMQLNTSGVCDDAIDQTDRCTYRDASEFFSHRRDGENTGRMAAVIAL